MNFSAGVVVVFACSGHLPRANLQGFQNWEFRVLRVLHYKAFWGPCASVHNILNLYTWLAALFPSVNIPSFPASRVNLYACYLVVFSFPVPNMFVESLPSGFENSGYQG